MGETLMNLTYYGSDRGDYIRPITDDFKGIKSPNDLYLALLNVWCEYTCAPRLRKNWSTDNITLGQCSVTAFLAQDIFGGRVFGIPRADGSYHCFNIVGGNIFDLTSEQFGDEELDYSNAIEQFRKVHFSDENKKERYEYLCDKLKEYLESVGETTEIKKHNINYIFLSFIVGISYFLYMVMGIEPHLDVKASDDIYTITIEGRTYNVNPGQNLTVLDNSGVSTTYNIRFVDGKPVALDLSQYTTLVLGETPEKEANKTVKKQEYKTNEKSEIPEKQNTEHIKDTSGQKPNRHQPTPFKPIPAQNSYPIVFNIEIKTDENDSNEDESESEEKNT